jgi:hypothetical protein
MSERFAIHLGEWFSANQIQVRKNLDRYFGGRARDEFSGRWFEKFAAMGDPNRFEPSDILAVEALSVDVRTESAAKLVLTEADRFSDLLAQIPLGVDLWEVDRSVVGSGSVAHKLHAAVDGLRGVGWVTAGKLMAAKRPRLIAILDEVKSVLKPPKGRFWVTLHDELSDDSRRQQIADVCDCAPDSVACSAGSMSRCGCMPPEGNGDGDPLQDGAVTARRNQGAGSAQLGTGSFSSLLSVSAV